MTAISERAARWLYDAAVTPVAGAWRSGGAGDVLVYDDGPGLRAVDVAEWLTVDGWVYARGTDGRVWVMAAAEEMR